MIRRSTQIRLGAHEGEIPETPAEVWQNTLSYFTPIVGVAAARRAAEMACTYQEMALDIDADYAHGLTDGIEEREAQAEVLREELEALWELWNDLGEAMMTEREVAAEEQLATTYMNPGYFVDRAGWISNMRSSLQTESFASGGWRGGIEPTDEQVIEAGKDAVERRLALRERYRAGKS